MDICMILRGQLFSYLQKSYPATHLLSFTYTNKEFYYGDGTLFLITGVWSVSSLGLILTDSLSPRIISPQRFIHIPYVPFGKESKLVSAIL